MILRAYTKKHGSSKPAGKAITKDILDDMLATLGDKLIDVRDKALLLFAWSSGGRRRTEVTNAEMKDLIKTPEGDFVYTIPKSKTDQTGMGNPVPIKGRAARALSDWLALSQVSEGAIFRAVSKGGAIGSALVDTDVYYIVKKILKKTGHDETRFTAHSLRSGYVTTAGRAGIPIQEVMKLTTHRSMNTVMRYYHAGDVLNNSGSNLAD